VENLSIIIPFYNEEKRLKKSFKILNNFLLNRKNAEIIFVNDGSNDQSENIIPSNSLIGEVLTFDEVCLRDPK